MQVNYNLNYWGLMLWRDTAEGPRLGAAAMDALCPQVTVAARGDSGDNKIDMRERKGEKKHQ